MKRFREMVKVYIEEERITKSEFARRLGMSPQNLNSLMKGNLRAEDRTLQFLVLYKDMKKTKAERIRAESEELDTDEDLDLFSD